MLILLSSNIIFNFLNNNNLINEFSNFYKIRFISKSIFNDLFIFYNLSKLNLLKNIYLH